MPFAIDTFVDKLSWDNYHEGIELKESIEKHRRRFGVYPEFVAVAKIFRTMITSSFARNGAFI